MQLEERTLSGLHAFLRTEVLCHYNHPGGRAVDLGAGSGALALQLRGLGFEVIGVDIQAEGFKAELPFVLLDLNEKGFASRLGEACYDLVTAVEAIEHVESPIGFLQNVRRLLKRSGVALITTPNVDNLPAKLRFLLGGKLRMMDERGDSTHISPIFWDLLARQYLPRAGLKLVHHYVFPPKGFKASRRRYAWLMGVCAQVLPGENLLGDNHVLVLEPGGEKAA